MEQRRELFEFVKDQHVGQVRKYTSEPYHTHLLTVGTMAEKTTANFGWEIGICHDLLEDTSCTKRELIEQLILLNYTTISAYHIFKCTVELTDVYTVEDFPRYNRAQRKQWEAERLSNISPDAQTVKYCDLIDNSSSILEHDKGFAVTYLAEQKLILSMMTKGDPAMYSRCLDCLNSAYKELDEYQLMQERIKDAK